MTNLLANGVAWMANRMRSVASEQGMYVRGSDNLSAYINPTLGSSTFEDADSEGGIIRTRVQDFIVVASELIIGGTVHEPKPGDRIHHAGNAFEVMNHGGNPPWRYAGPDRIRMRIHTRQVN